MSRKISDGWLWLGLGITLYVALECVAKTLRHVAHTVEEEEAAGRDDSKAGFAVVEQIDEISSESLKVLATCQNFHIRKAATRIFLDRVLLDKDVVQQLARDLKQTSASDGLNRHRALNALNLFNTEGYTISGHVRSQLPQELHRHLPVPTGLETSDDDPLSPNRVRALLAGAMDGNVSEQEVEDMLTLLQDDLENSGFTTQQQRDFATMRRLRRQLVEQGSELLPSLTNAGEEQAVPRPRRRVTDESPQEQARRRRRREAMVLNEGDHPLGQEDIFQRRRTEDGAPRNAPS